jgi:hypothetical protein
MAAAQAAMQYLARVAEEQLPRATERLAALCGPLTDIQQLDACLDTLALDCGLAK